MALHGAKLQLHPDIREKAADVAEYYVGFSSGKGAPDLDGLLERLVRETQPRDASDLLESVLAEMNLMPTEADLGEALFQGLGERELPRLSDGGQGRAGIAIAGPAANVVREGLRSAPGLVDPRTASHRGESARFSDAFADDGD